MTKYIVIYLLYFIIVPDVYSNDKKLYGRLFSDVDAYLAPKIDSKKIWRVVRYTDVDIIDYSNEISVINDIPRLWLKIAHQDGWAYGWIYSKDIIIETPENSLKSNCSNFPNFHRNMGFHFPGFELILLDNKIAAIHSVDLGNSFTQQIGKWEMRSGEILLNFNFIDSTLTDCLNVCFENENSNEKSCRNVCKTEILNEFGKLKAEALVQMKISLVDGKMLLFVTKAVEKNIKKKPFLPQVGIKVGMISEKACD
ncbi:hypothetical protein V6Z05_15070 [Leptospira venezuelensis]|uniref:hypothetical protein n=1 Tax=Leptospira venezuelensis TaxID=1958811 RepID=UPI000A36DEF0|nr:hypothetical protein [Leptospira venezuelensis]